MPVSLLHFDSFLLSPVNRVKRVRLGLDLLDLLLDVLLDVLNDLGDAVLLAGLVPQDTGALDDADDGKEEVNSGETAS